MLPDPLHPAVVHFPMVLVVLLPIAALGALWAVRRGASIRRAWAIPLAFAAALAVSSWVAVETGESDEERVERVAGEAALHEHEEAAERFLVLSGALLLLTAAGLAPGALGRAGRLLSTVGAVGLIVAGVQVGAAGGALVYEHGAAGVYVQDAGRASADLPGGAGLEQDDDE
jgi:uncharacterized membrane protein